MKCDILLFKVQRFSILLFLSLLPLSVHAIPAKRGIWKTITLEDGTRVHVELRGDENGHFFIDRNGNTYVKNEWGTYSISANHPIDDERAASSLIHSSLIRPRRLNGIPTDKSLFQGKKKGIVILAQFPAGNYIQDGKTISEEAVSFSTETPALLGCETTKELYEKIINQRNLGNDPMRGPFTGSVKDYFIDQSHGQFELDFDIAGPYTLSHPRHYYGANNASNNDTLPGKMVYEAVNLAIAAGINFSQYDWDDDNVVDQVFVLYAGQGEADGGPSDCIWPHEYYLAYSYQTITTTVNGKQITINQYACSNELATNGRYSNDSDEFIVNGTQIAGIGTICHEFSHCIGYPDMYDVAYENYGMGNWDLMDSGSYNGTWNGGHDDWEELRAGYQPAGYTAFEKWCAGWIEPIVLDNPQKVTHALSLQDDNGGYAYVIYLPGSQQSIEGEYYIIENRQQHGWDSSLPWHGLLVTYVHYNQALWRNNCLNCTNAGELTRRHASNTHQRMAVFQAGGKDPGFLSLDAYPYHLDYLPQLLGDTWGTTGLDIATNLNNRYAVKGLELNLADNDILADDTTPQAYYWGSGNTVQPLADHDIWDIQENEDDAGSVSFIYGKLKDDHLLALDQDSSQPQEIEAGLYSSATINRQFTTGIYNTLWLPFNMNGNEIRSCWGEHAEIYRLTDVSVDDEGKFVLNITEDTHNGIRAYEPILLKIDENDTRPSTSFNHYIQVSQDTDSIQPIVELANGWKFVGTKKDGYVPERARYLKDNKHYMAGDNTTRIRAYRAYFVAPNDIDSPSQGQAKSQMTVAYNINRHQWLHQQTPEPIDTMSIESPFFEPNGQKPTAITHKTAQITEASSIYDLSGRKVTIPKNKGIYIIGGKKTLSFPSL